MLRLKDVTTVIGGFEAVRGVSLEIKKGEFVALLGSNGAGKSTLFRTIAGVLKPSRGSVEFRSEIISRLPAHSVVGMGLSLCPEGRQLFPQLSVCKNLMLGAYTRRKDPKGVERTLNQVYDLFPILKERTNQMAGTLSGGEQQMLAIGRALMSQPDMLLLDEPSMGLAPLVVRKIAEIIKTINEMGTTVFLSEQNAHMALMITQRGYVLENGRLVLEGPSRELLNNSLVKKAYLGA
ncbi:MAG: ABC transporter ATP-binding protein [Peptococcaceae bacterium]|nr:ABC transporter ATP-binding protein [Peptococcaceae bacterium]